MHSSLRSTSAITVLFACLLSFSSKSVVVGAPATVPQRRADLSADPDYPISDPEHPFENCLGTSPDASADGGPTEDGQPGIGVEFETAAIEFKNPACSETDTDAAKGKRIDDRAGDDWVLTADTTQNSPGSLTAEYILDGKTIKLGTGRAGKAAAELAADLSEWKPAAGLKVNIEDNSCNPWEVKSPKKWTGSDAMFFSRQVTAPLPLEAINDLMKKTKTGGVLTDPLLPGLKRYIKNMVHVTSDFFQSDSINLESDSVGEEVMGFFALVLTYAKKADGVQSGDSPKKLSSIMPRTDFQAMYGMISEQIKDALEDSSLFDVVKILACYRNEGEEGEVELDGSFCTGDLANPVPNDKMDNMKFHIASGGETATLSIKDWMQSLQEDADDLLAKADKIVDGQIGGLGDATENVLDTDRKVPLFEFRDLGSSTPSQFQRDVEKAENRIVEYHKQFQNTPTRRSLWVKRQMKLGKALQACPMWGPPNGSNSSVEARSAARPGPVRVA